MSSSTTFGATIVHPSPSKNDYDVLIPLAPSPTVSPAVSRDGLHPEFSERPMPTLSTRSASPYSERNLYPGRPPKESLKDAIAVFEKELESGSVTPLSPSEDTNPFRKNINVEKNDEDTMWPSKATLRGNKKLRRKLKRERKGCTACAPVRNWWSGLSKQQRIMTHVGIALLIVGIAVAVGVSISIAVSGTYYVSNGASKTVGQ